MPTSVFDVVENGPPIEVFALNRAFTSDESSAKVNLGVGGKYSQSAQLISYFDLCPQLTFLINQLKLTLSTLFNQNRNQG